MLTNARTVAPGTTLEADLCIVGGGAAGISLARELVDAGFEIVLLESGGTAREEATQGLYAGTDVGHPYKIFDESRLRYFGGTTNHWGGVWCDLPTPLDFERREGVPHSGWPFELSYLEPWYRRAQSVLKLGTYGYACSQWGIADNDIPDPFRGPHFVCRVLQQGPATRFGPEYGPALRRARNISVYTYANALYFEASENGSEVRKLHVGVLGGSRFSVRARFFVLASGGIENARLLLLSRLESRAELGNPLVGRFFMLHFEYSGGAIEFSDRYANLAFQTGENGARHRREGVVRRFVSYLGLSDSTRKALDLPNVRYRFQYPRPRGMDSIRGLVYRAERDEDSWPGIGSIVRDLPETAAYVARRMVHGRNKPSLPLAPVELKCTAEQMPNPESRIRLGSDQDAFGLPRVVVDWQLTAEDRRGMATGQFLLERELARSGFGRLTNAPATDDTGCPSDMQGDQHHMGTTRMHQDPSQGVVDENGRVHGVANLYVAGSSVFPIGGTFNPTLTIVALTLRLADQLRERLRRPNEGGTSAPLAGTTGEAAAAAELATARR